MKRDPERRQWKGQPDRKPVTRDYWQSPSDIVNLATRMAVEIAEGRHGISFGIPEVDRVIKPVSSGQVGLIVGRPSGGKTLLLTALAARETARIVAEGKTATDGVIFASLEMPTEYLVNNVWKAAGLQGLTSAELLAGGFDLREQRIAIAQGARMPVYGIGSKPYDHISRTHWWERETTTEEMLHACRDIVETNGLKRVSIFIDYLQVWQSLRYQGANDKTAGVEMAMKASKILALDLEAPVILAAQAGRQTDDNRPVQVPEIGDIQHSSAAEQIADTVVGVFRPARVAEIGEEMTFARQTFRVDDRQIGLKLLKQRLGIGHGAWVADLDPRTSVLRPRPIQGPSRPTIPDFGGTGD